MTIQMADRSVKAPRGVLEDVLLKIENFMFPVDFVILDMEGVNAEHQTPIILGRPFLATANACINCRTGVLEISFGNQKLRINIFHAAVGPAGDRCISFAEAEDEDVDEAAHEASMAVYTSSFSDPELDIFPGGDSSTMLYDNSLGFSSILDFDDSSHDPYPIVISLNHSSPDVLASSHSLSFEEREADGGYDVLATTTLHRNRSHPMNQYESLPPIALEPDSSSLESLSVLELKPQPHTLKYPYLGSNDSLSVIISSILSLKEEKRLLAVLRWHKRAIGWKMSDLRGINLAFCMHRIHTLEDSEWASLVQMVPKKTGLAVVKNEHGEDISTRAQTGWRVCIDYRKLNAATQKDHFSLPFLDQVLEKLAGQSNFCFLDGYSGYNQVAVYPDDQEKTTFTCPFGTFAFRRMSFGLCNTPGTFQRCMLSIFLDMLDDTMEVFMDDFSIYSSSFDDLSPKIEKSFDQM
ncbi:unnamed protein product [Victoria cruziana]